MRLNRYQATCEIAGVNNPDGTPRSIKQAVLDKDSNFAAVHSKRIVANRFKVREDDVTLTDIKCTENKR